MPKKDTLRGLATEFGLRLAGVVGQSVGEAIRESAVRGRAAVEREAEVVERKRSGDDDHGLARHIGTLEQRIRQLQDGGKEQSRQLADKLDRVMRTLRAQNTYESSGEQVAIADVIARLRADAIVPLGAPGEIEAVAKELEALAESTGPDNVEETMGFVRDIAKQLRAAIATFRVTSMSSVDLKRLAIYMGENYAGLVADKVSSRDVSSSNWSVDLAIELLDEYRKTSSLELQLRKFILQMATEHSDNPHLMSARTALDEGIPFPQVIMRLLASMVSGIQVRASLAAHKMPAEDEDRVETGPLQIGEEDWPGVFIRGDNAMHFGLNLATHLDMWEPGECEKILYGVLRDLRSLLGSCVVPVEPGKLQKYKRYAVNGGGITNPPTVEELGDAPTEDATRAPRAGEGDEL